MIAADSSGLRLEDLDLIETGGCYSSIAKGRSINNPMALHKRGGRSS